jgi:hypothetical protein
MWQPLTGASYSFASTCRCYRDMMFEDGPFPALLLNTRKIIWEIGSAEASKYTQARKDAERTIPSGSKQIQSHDLRFETCSNMSPDWYR